ncbi:hypothetical protein [Actinoallomurus sp. NPDC050550]|uniref:hypothetical protein n=1 Tax=Actinoallomurus sp. NPDC050550 TaxID=3154937 RepID=UPI00341029EE
MFRVHVVRKMADSVEGSTTGVLPHTGHLAVRENSDAGNAEIDAFMGYRTAVRSGAV